MNWKLGMHAFLIIISLAAASTAARAQVKTEQQLYAAMGMAAAASTHFFCPEFRPDLYPVMAAVTSSGLDIRSPGLKTQVEQLASKLSNRYKEIGPQKYCEAAWLAWGDDGAIIAGVLKKKAP